MPLHPSIEMKSPPLRFTGHETFPLRYLWPVKGVRGVRAEPALFAQDAAMVKLGVGQNMVRAIRHWCEVLELIAPDPGGSNGLRPTALGDRLFGEDGWDPFIEYPGTPWLLHWLMTRRRENASAWFLLFTQWSAVTFTRDDLVDWLLCQAEQSGSRATRGSMKRDVGVLLRTYIPTAGISDRVAPEETFDSPLAELGLLTETERGVYSLPVGRKDSLPQPIFLFALLDYLDRGEARASVSFENLLYEPGSPGAAFKLSESALAERLERLPADVGLHFDETAGMRSLLGQTTGTTELRLDILAEYYGESDGAG